MARNYLNYKAQANRDYEAHKSECGRLTDITNSRYLGEFANYASAVAESRREHYAQSKGSFYCSRECHIS